MDTNLLIFLSFIFFAISIYLAILAAKNEKMLAFLTSAHYISLIIILIGSILTWVALTWMTNPDKFIVTPKQKISLVFSILLGLFFWGRFVFVVSDNLKGVN